MYWFSSTWLKGVQSAGECRRSCLLDAGTAQNLGEHQVDGVGVGAAAQAGREMSRSGQATHVRVRAASCVAAVDGETAAEGSGKREGADLPPHAETQDAIQAVQDGSHPAELLNDAFGVLGVPGGLMGGVCAVAADQGGEVEIGPAVFLGFVAKEGLDPVVMVSALRRLLPHGVAYRDVVAEVASGAQREKVPGGGVAARVVLDAGLHGVAVAEEAGQLTAGDGVELGQALPPDGAVEHVSVAGQRRGVFVQLGSDL
ncbi:glucose-6-phosphate dehydrogenase [Babesia caballi]|uniref:Glucose-6-phosphate dehydrogenase n=1 Tax=Babesia caballi TaxID=5871 RepID=A0AAV4LXB1_BABCB|nr:glucose-6-phosphate dehydrogenase [Babesia caballi]